MNKFTIFTIIISVVIIVTIAELLVNNYFGVVVNPHDVSTNILAPLEKKKTSDNDIYDSALETDEVALLGSDVSGPVVDGAKADDGAQNDGAKAEIRAPSSSKDEKDEFDPARAVTQEDLQKSGFLGLTLKTVPFEGKIFQSIDLSGFTQEFTQYHIADDRNVYGVVAAAWFYEDLGGASEFYEFLKQESSKVTDVSVNETNEYGKASFFFNDAKRVGTAFLVVRIDNRVYAMSYPKASHDFYKQLIGNLLTR